MTDTQIPTSEVLYRAADLIEERGWARGTGWPVDDPRTPTDGSLCLEGGIMAAAGIVVTPNPRGHFTDDRFEPLTTCPAYLAARAYLGDALAKPTTPLWAWNDRRKSATEVIEVLRAAAVIEAAKENAETRQAVTS